ncbi:hypothetical protein LPB72_10530 [Hydrogenophaga crassostreae]|nr:hypothetical protein LPB72_10530 [Hydrogenophaga crassostreae]
MGHVVLGGAAALVLSACGGGGDSSTNSKDLVVALDRLEPGMTIEEAIAAIGWPANAGDRAWTDSGNQLLLFTKGKPYDDATYLDVATLRLIDRTITRYYFVE